MFKRSHAKRRSRADKIFTLINGIIMAFLSIMIIYPLYYILVASFTDPSIVASGKFLLYPEKLFLDGYQEIFKYRPIWTGYRNSIVYTVLNVALALAVTLPAAYVLSRKDMMCRRGILFLFTFTMFFSGGMIPNYLLVKDLGILNTPWAVILPVSCSAWNLIVARTFYQSLLPDELLEAARIDGCNDFTFFFRIVLPLSSTIIAVIGLFVGVSQWNSYFNALMYLSDDSTMPLQVILRNLLIINQMPEILNDAMGSDARAKLAEQMRFGVIVVGALPLLCIYPFIQKYFEKGVMIGSVKG